MKLVNSTIAKKPILMWLDDLEFSAMDQARNVANHPAVFHHVALMPDAHTGNGVPIGCVFASENSVIPNAVGVDIGCGMTAVKTNLTEFLIRKHATDIQDFVKESNITSVRRNVMYDLAFNHLMRQSRTKVVSDVDENSLNQLGTLGGGNHFIEFQKDEDKNIWLMVHSGSRNLGQVVAKHYDGLAKQANAAFFANVDPKQHLAFLPLDQGSPGQDYLTDMKWAVGYARVNRECIIHDIIAELDSICKADIIESINCCHNFAAMENHYGKNVLVHRKGATMARRDQLGLIPGSQGTSSYVVEGLGNEKSFYSCSHGAGRTMSRSKAKELLDLEMEKSILDGQNIIHSMNSVSSLDEAPNAYKNITEVMANQEDLVKIKHRLQPILVIKN